MREKVNMRDRVCTKKKEESEKVFEKRKNLSACYGHGSHIYQSICKIEMVKKQY